MPGTIPGRPPVTGAGSRFRFFGSFGLFCSTVLIMRVLVAVLRDGVNETGIRVGGVTAAVTSW